MQTHSITLTVQVNFEYNPESREHREALSDALDLAFNPNFHSLLNGTKITGVSVLDQTSSHKFMQYGED